MLTCFDKASSVATQQQLCYTLITGLMNHLHFIITLLNRNIIFTYDCIFINSKNDTSLPVRNFKKIFKTTNFSSFNYIFENNLLYMLATNLVIKTSFTSDDNSLVYLQPNNFMCVCLHAKLNIFTMCGLWREVKYSIYSMLHLATYWKSCLSILLKTSHTKLLVEKCIHSVPTTYMHIHIKSQTK